MSRTERTWIAYKFYCDHGIALLKLIAMTSPKKKRKPSEPLKSGDVPVTQSMLYAVRDELKSHIISHEGRFNSIDKRFDSIDKKFDSIDKRFESVDKRFDAVDKRFDSMENKMDSIYLEMLSRFDEVYSKFDKIDFKFDEVKSKIDKLAAEIHQGNVLKEEQGAQNKFVLDQYALVIHLCEKLDKRIEQSERNFHQLLKAQRSV